MYYIRGEKLEINSLVIFKNHVCTFQTYLVILRKKIFKYLRGYIFARTSSRTCNRSKIGRGETGMSDRKRREGSAVHGRANWIATYISIQQMKIDFDAVPLIIPSPSPLPSSLRIAGRHLMNARTPKPVKRHSVFVILEKSG